MGKKADELLEDIKRLRQGCECHRGAAAMSAEIADQNKSSRLAGYHAGEKSGLNTAIELLDDLIGDWED